MNNRLRTGVLGGLCFAFPTALLLDEPYIHPAVQYGIACLVGMLLGRLLYMATPEDE